MEKLLTILESYEATIQLLITLAIVVERISEIIITYNEKWFNNFKFKEELTSPMAKQITTMIVSLILTFSISVVLIPSLEINMVMNKVLAGIVISLGSNILHDLLKMLTEFKDILKVSKELKEIDKDITLEYRNK